MTRPIGAALVLAIAATQLALPQNQPVRRESTEWTDVWMPHSNDHDLPRVLLIGDSITRAYYAAVEENLKGKAYVARITTSKAIGDPALLLELAIFLAEAQFDVVHFNIGMHGWAYTEDEYRSHYPQLVQTLRSGQAKAKLIAVTTTPVRNDRASGPSNARITIRNTIVKEYAAGHALPVDDLSTLMTPHADLHSDDVHFNKEGSAILGAQVAREIEKWLPARSAR